MNRSFAGHGVIVAIVALTSAALGGCSKLDGQLTATVDGKPVKMRSAYVVSQGRRRVRSNFA